MPGSKRIVAVTEMSDSDRSVCRSWHAKPIIFPDELPAGDDGASATGKIARGSNLNPDDVDILRDSDTWARQ